MRVLLLLFNKTNDGGTNDAPGSAPARMGSAVDACSPAPLLGLVPENGLDRGHVPRVHDDPHLRSVDARVSGGAPWPQDCDKGGLIMYDEEWLRRKRQAAWMITGASVAAIIVWCSVLATLMKG